MDILNHDGSFSGVCGNGMRCVADLVIADDATAELSIEADGAMLRTSRAGNGEIAVDMGPVATGWNEVPVAHEMDTLAVPSRIDGLGPAICHSIGNPHAVVFVEDAEAVRPRTGLPWKVVQ